MIRKLALVSAMGLAACAAPQNLQPHAVAQSATQPPPSQDRSCEGAAQVAIDAIPFESVFGADRGSAVVVEAADDYAIVATTFDVADAQLANVVVAPHVDSGLEGDSQVTTSEVVYANVQRNIALYRFPRHTLPAAPVTLRKREPSGALAAVGQIGRGTAEFVRGDMPSKSTLRFDEALGSDSYALFDTCGRLAGLVNSAAGGSAGRGELIPAVWIVEALEAFHHPASTEVRVRETARRFGDAVLHDDYLTASFQLSRTAYWEIGEQFYPLVARGEQKIEQARAALQLDPTSLDLLDLDQKVERFGEKLDAAERVALKVVANPHVTPVNAGRVYWGILMAQAAAKAPRLVAIDVETVSVGGEADLGGQAAMATFRLEFANGTVRHETVQFEEVAGRMLLATVKRPWWQYDPGYSDSSVAQAAGQPK
ncbi:MAG: hypothetical protein AB7K71_04655 [Polyangiaceae bacterium]